MRWSVTVATREGRRKNIEHRKGRHNEKSCASRVRRQVKHVDQRPNR